MAGRSIEVRGVQGLEEHLQATILTEANTRTVKPDAQLQALVSKEALAWLRERAVNEQHISFAVYKWPSNGPAHFGLLFAYNPRTDQTMRAAFSETTHERDLIASWDEAEMQLNMFALKQFGTPTAV